MCLCDVALWQPVEADPPAEQQSEKTERKADEPDLSIVTLEGREYGHHEHDRR
jgi:hypothetical protein